MPPKKDPKEEEEEEDEEEEEEQTPLEFVAELPDGVRQNVLAMQALQEKYQGLFLEYVKEVSAVEKKYEGLYAPLYAKRREIVSGAREPTAEEVRSGEEAAEETSKVEELPEDGAAAETSPRHVADADSSEKGIPRFWMEAMLNNDTLQDMIKEYDKDALVHLTDVRCTTKDNPHDGFELQFDFSDNPFFSNKTLTKVCLTKLDEEDGEDELLKLVGCDIQWKDGKNLTVELKKKKQRSKQGKGSRVVTREEPRLSFFNFFSPPDMPDDDDEDADDELTEKGEEDYEQCLAFKEALIQRAVDYFTGDAVPQIDFGVDAEEDEEEGDDAGSAGDGAGKKKGGEQQQECKQQ